jgi:hypothetical protein
MNAYQTAIVHFDNLVLAVLLVGLVVNRQYRRCYFFGTYIACILLWQLLIVLWQDRFRTPGLWVAKEFVLHLLKFGIAIELSVRVFRAFPGAHATVNRVFFAVLAITCVVLIGVPYEPDYKTLAGRLQPRIVNGTIWLFTGLAGLILWYRLPVDPLHKAILLGFVPYLLIFTVTMNALDAFGWHLLDWISYPQTLAFVILTLYWAYICWRPERHARQKHPDSGRSRSDVTPGTQSPPASPEDLGAEDRGRQR